MENKERLALFTTVLPDLSTQFDEYGNKVKQESAYESRNILSGKGDLSSTVDLSGTVIMSLTSGSVHVGLPMDVTLRLDCYSDNTCRLVLEVAQFGVELEADQGAYHVSETNKFTFHFENAGELTGEPDYASATESSIDVMAAYKAKLKERFNGSMLDLTIDTKVKGTYVTGGATMAG